MKRLLSVVLSLLLCFTSAIYFVGCTKKNDDSSSSTGGEVVKPDDDDRLSEQIDEFVPASQKIEQNAKSLTMSDIKNANGNVMPLLFKGVTFGNLVKTAIEENSSEGSFKFILNRYKDGKWRCGTKATEIDSDLNVIFEYELFSGALDMSERRLEIVGDKKIIDLFMESLLNTQFSIEKTLEKMEGQSGDGSFDMDMGIAMGIISAFPALTENKAVYELVKPLLLLSVRDFYDITVDNGKTYFKNTYTAMDVDVYISLAFYLINKAEPEADTANIEKLLCDLVGGTVKNPQWNTELPVQQLLDDLAAVCNAENNAGTAALFAVLKSSLGGTLGNPEYPVFTGTVKELTATAEKLLALLGVNKDISDVIVKVLGEVLIDGEQGIEINSACKISDIIDKVVTDEELAAKLKEIFGDMTVGDLLAAGSEFINKVDAAITAIGNAYANVKETLTEIWQIAKKYIDTETDPVSLNKNVKVTELCSDIRRVVELCAGTAFNETAKAVFDELEKQVGLLYADTTLKTLVETTKAFDVKIVVTAIGNVAKAGKVVNEEVIDHVVGLVNDVLVGTIGNCKVNDDTEISTVIADIKSIVNDFLSEGAVKTTVFEVLDQIDALYGDSALGTVVADTKSLNIDAIINAIGSIGALPEEVKPVLAMLGVIFDGTVVNPKVDENVRNSTVGEILENFGFVGVADDPVLGKFCDFTVGELLDYLNGGENAEMDKAIGNIALEDIINALGGGKTEIPEPLAA